MAILYFDDVFQDQVESGKKRLSFRRSPRQYGERVELFINRSGMSPQHVGNAQVTSCLPIVIGIAAVRVGEKIYHSIEDKDAFARSDGFKNYDTLLAYAAEKYKGLPFKGYLVSWNQPKK